uniref:Uncharacterized protein n=1 Tax=Parascaris equorum TaxID=6256 RepID=A0A914R8S4_PAREQ
MQSGSCGFSLRTMCLLCASENMTTCFTNSVSNDHFFLSLEVCMIEGIKECSMDLNEEQQKNFVLAWQHLLDIVVRDMRNGYDERRPKLGESKRGQKVCN